MSPIEIKKIDNKPIDSTMSYLEFKQLLARYKRSAYTKWLSDSLSEPDLLPALDLPKIQATPNI